MKIAYVTILNPKDYLSWSGLNLNIYRCLKKNNQIDCIGPLNRFPKLFYVIKRIIYSLFKVKFDADRVVTLSKYYSYLVKKKIKKKYDLIVTSDTATVAFLKTEIPIIIWTDVMFSTYFKHYFSKKKIHPKTIKDGNEIDNLISNKASAIFLTSEWSKKDAIKKYNIPKNKIKILPFGSNIEMEPSLKKIIFYKNQRKKCKIITIGVDWRRKGIDRTISICKLIKKKIDIELTIVGSANSKVNNFPSWIKVVPFLNKNIKTNHNLLSKYLLESHFHFLFPLAEACGVVFAEASSHGSINISHNLGGIGEMVKNNANGYLFQTNTSEKRIANYVIKTFKNKKKYISFVKKTHNFYLKKLKWTELGKKFFSQIS